MTLGNRLQRLRQRQGLSQDALAEKLGVSRQAVSKWERDEAVPEVEKLLRLSELYGVSLDELVKGDAPESARTCPLACCKTCDTSCPMSASPSCVPG